MLFNLFVSPKEIVFFIFEVSWLFPYPIFLRDKANA
jgi:hypothetical protein